MRPERNGEFTVRLHAKLTLTARKARSLSGARQEFYPIVSPTLARVRVLNGGNSRPPCRLSRVNIAHGVARGVNHEITRPVIRPKVLPTVRVRVSENVRIINVCHLDTFHVGRINRVPIEEIPRNVQPYGIINLAELFSRQAADERRIIHTVEFAAITAGLNSPREAETGVTRSADQMGARRGARFPNLTVGCTDETSFDVAAFRN